MGCLIPIAVILLIPILSGIKQIFQYERGIVFTLGKFSKILEPGIHIVIPTIQTLVNVDMRIKTGDIPRQEVMTKDNIPVLANAVVYYKVERPADAIIQIESYDYAVKQYTQAALRDVIGNSELDFVLTKREQVATEIKKIVDQETSEWGVNIESIKIQEIELPAEMKRVMAKQAEAERQKRAAIIAAEGELKASENLEKAAAILAKNPAAMHLRTLQTVRDIAADPSEKIVLFLPSEMKDLAKTVSSVAKETLA
ncbi:slipin family protein [Candidatus Dojkabacteria bacterium]|nr:slipin family protein [Candidatus Dojkabacteria bacterium]